MKDRVAIVAAAAQASRVVELRQYTLHPGRRDALIDLFEREFVQGQEREGIHVLGQFRDLDDPQRFVWMRGFADMASRRDALQRFYDGPIWRAHREAANRTMIDSDDVLLLRPIWADASLGACNDGEPSAVATAALPDPVVTVWIQYAQGPIDDDIAGFLAGSVAPALGAAGAKVVAAFATESASNDFPRLPVREGEHVAVWVARFDHADAWRRCQDALQASARWQDAAGALRQRFHRSQTLHLSPTPRSRLR